LPTICVQRWRVAYVSAQASRGRLGHVSEAAERLGALTPQGYIAGDAAGGRGYNPPKFPRFLFYRRKE
jgi:hypothetical protein